MPKSIRFCYKRVNTNGLHERFQKMNMATANTTILIADDHELVREGLRHSLTEFANALTILSASNFSEAFDAINNNPDLSLALIDLNMPDMNGIQALNKMMSEFPSLPVVVLSASEDVDVMHEIIEMGAMGFIPKSESNAVIISAVQLVLSGGIYLPRVLLNPKKQKFNNTVKSALTPRQTEVLTLLTNGESNKAIARDLGLSDITVKAHLSAIFKALNVSNRTQAVIKAGKLGLTR